MSFELTFKLGLPAGTNEDVARFLLRELTLALDETALKLAGSRPPILEASVQDTRPGNRQQAGELGVGSLDEPRRLEGLVLDARDGRIAVRALLDGQWHTAFSLSRGALQEALDGADFSSSIGPRGMEVCGS